MKPGRGLGVRTNYNSLCTSIAVLSVFFRMYTCIERSLKGWNFSDRRFPLHFVGSELPLRAALDGATAAQRAGPRAAQPQFDACIAGLDSPCERTSIVGSDGRLLNDLDGEPDSPSKGWLGHARGSIGARCARRRSDRNSCLSAPYSRKVARRAGLRAGVVWLWRSDWVRGLTS